MDLSSLGTVDKADLALAVLMAGTVPNNFSAPCPSWFTISSDFFNDQGSHEGNRKRIRQGETAGALLSIAEGWAVSVIADTWLPLVFTVLIVAVMVGGYEFSMAHPAAEEG